MSNSSLKSVQILPESSIQMHPTEWKSVNSPIFEQATFAIKLNYTNWVKRPLKHLGRIQRPVINEYKNIKFTLTSYLDS